MAGLALLHRFQCPRPFRLLHLAPSPSLEYDLFRLSEWRQQPRWVGGPAVPALSPQCFLGLFRADGNQEGKVEQKPSELLNCRVMEEGLAVSGLVLVTGWDPRYIPLYQLSLFFSLASRND